MSLRAKLFLILLSVSLVTIVVTHVFVRWSFLQGLRALAAERQAERLDAISERLRDIHRVDGGWHRLAQDKRLWVRALAGSPAEGRHMRRWPRPEHRPESGSEHAIGRAPDSSLLDGADPVGGGDEPPPAHRGGPRPPPWLRDLLRGRLGEPGAWPPRRTLARLKAGEPPGPLELRIMLLDADGALVYGRPSLLAEAERLPLLDGAERIGTLVILPGPSITERPELRFRERQIVSLWVIVLGVSLLGALLAFPLSKRLTRPVREFQRTTRRLATGDYDARVQATGADELGRLGRDLNALAEALAHAEQARRQWVADISHELRTPLSLLRADLEAMQDGVRPLDRAALDHLHADLLRLGRLVDDLYELSMTDLGALSYRRAPLDVASLLRHELEAFRGPFHRAGLRLYLETDDSDGRVDGDAHRLSQLFRNLLRNSLAYTDSGGELRVRLSGSRSSVSIAFDDSAPGVPESDLPRLFERLYRVDGSRSRATGGAGLGLAIARNIVQAHGGSITASTSDLGGLRVLVELPADGPIPTAPLPRRPPP